jgi:acylaminoacyl-peptidase
MTSPKPMPLFLLLALLAWTPLAAPKPATLTIAQALAIESPLSAHALRERKETESLERALLGALRREPPQAGRRLAFPGAERSWRSVEVAAARAGGLWAVYLEAERFIQPRLRLSGLRGALLWLGERRLELKQGEAELRLSRGVHRLLILHDGREGEAEPTLELAGERLPRPRLQPSGQVDPERLTNARTAERLAVDPGGRWLAVGYRRRDETTGESERWLAVHALPEGRLVATLPLAADALAFSAERGLAIASGEALLLLDPVAGELRTLLRKRKGLASPRWLADGTLLFLASEPVEGGEPKGLKRLTALEDRWPEFREPKQLFRLDPQSGLILPVGARPLGVQLLDVHPKSPRVLLGERLIDYAEPPHERFRVFELDLESGAERELARPRQLETWRYREEGGFLVLAGPNAFEGRCREEGVEVANDYDHELFVLDPAGGFERCLSRGFAPALLRVERAARGLLASAHDGDRVRLYRIAGAERFEPLPFAIEVLEDFAADAEGRLIAALGSGAILPQRLELLRDGRLQLLFDGAKEYPGLALGEVRDFRFTTRDGLTIDGRYYLPPDFSPGRRHPLIVYWYGGTLPVTRAFTGRYPFHLWAAHGYVVYVLQPRGTIGYGQRFSAYHVNAWGKETAEDILEGVEAFLRAHPFVDPERVGGIGASYGGFMSMYLATRSERFRALVAHAGISLLPAYWGEGFWGYSYSGIASRGSFPWNAPELYLGQSPLFAADRIRTPLLLLTGDRDRNVPPGESHAMFTALRLLGREVELVEVEGEDHWVLDPVKRYAWWEAMLAWFDRHLKDEGEWWRQLFPERPGVAP